MDHLAVAMLEAVVGAAELAAIGRDQTAAAMVEAVAPVAFVVGVAEPGDVLIPSSAADVVGTASMVSMDDSV